MSDTRARRGELPERIAERLMCAGIGALPSLLPEEFDGSEAVPGFALWSVAAGGGSEPDTVSSNAYACL